MQLSSEQEFENTVTFLENASASVITSISITRLQKPYHWLCRVFLFTGLICLFTYINESWGNMNKIAKINIYVSLLAQSLLKSMILSTKREEVIEFVQRIRKFRKDHIKTEKEVDMMKEYTVKSNRSSKAFIIMFEVATITVMCTPWLFSEVELPVALVIPGMPSDHAPYFAINYAYQVCLIMVDAVMDGAMDGMFAFFLQEACLQLDIVKEKLKHLGEDKMLTQEEHAKMLGNIYIVHLEANRFVFALDKAFSLMQFVQFTFSTSLITFLLVGSAESSEIDYGIYSLMLSVWFQIFIRCWFGEQTRYKMNTILQSMYDNYWYNLDPGNRKSLAIMMSCCQKDQCLSAGGLIDLTLGTFVAIVRTAYSYYAVMQDRNK